MATDLGVRTESFTMGTRTMKPAILRTLDLFAGCGGLTAGFATAKGPGSSRFECVGAIDNWWAACDSFVLNHATLTVARQDAEMVVWYLQAASIVAVGSRKSLAIGFVSMFPTTTSK